MKQFYIAAILTCSFRVVAQEASELPSIRIDRPVLTPVKDGVADLGPDENGKPQIVKLTPGMYINTVGWEKLNDVITEYQQTIAGLGVENQTLKTEIEKVSQQPGLSWKSV